MKVGWRDIDLFVLILPSERSVGRLVFSFHEINRCKKHIPSKRSNNLSTYHLDKQSQGLSHIALTSRGNFQYPVIAVMASPLNIVTPPLIRI